VNDQEKDKALKKLLAELERTGESANEDLQQMIAGIEQEAEERIQQIKNYEKETIHQFLLTR
jgi:uncharacterized protein Yka (UPF0111/DUF47 family)